MGQDVMLRPIEKENVILKLVEKLWSTCYTV
jgi:hypothetical protein